MVKKTKVIAFRVNADEYEELIWLADEEDQSLSEFVYKAMMSNYHLDMYMARKELNAKRKKAEAKAKRQAKKEAQSGVQS